MVYLKEAKAQEYFPPASLSAHLSHSWKVAIDLMCGELCRYLLEEYPKSWENAATAIMHPEICRHTPYNDTFEKVIGVGFDFDKFLRDESGDLEMVEIQNYLRDQERAGRFFVDGGMYATLSLRLFKVIFASETL
jgi:hypothetical protein